MGEVEHRCRVKVDAKKQAEGERGDVGKAHAPAAANAHHSMLDSLSPRVKALLMAQPLNPLVRGEFSVLPSGVKALNYVA